MTAAACNAADEAHCRSAAVTGAARSAADEAHRRNADVIVVHRGVT